MLMLSTERRAQIWRRLVEVIESYMTTLDSRDVTPKLDADEIRSLITPFNFAQPVDPIDAINFVVEGLLQYQTHSAHPRYFGLFNPTPTAMGIAADALVAAFNPQLAAWAHSPFAAEIEEHLVKNFGGRFGYRAQEIDGTFTSGGSEANHTALLTALTHVAPDFITKGARALGAPPVFYISTEGHHSLLKAAQLCGLGTESLREVNVDDQLRLKVEELADQVARDKANGCLPFMVVATAGTTNAGIIDPIPQIADLAKQERLWLHVDAAWGGACAIVPEFSNFLDGIERSDSITFDSHKLLSVPMGAGLYLTRHREILERTFRVKAPYAPIKPEGQKAADPYEHSMQWSRRFIGLKVFLSLAVAGWEGYADVIRHQFAMGDQLRWQLEEAGWEVLNRTPLPLACFADRTCEQERSAAYLERIENEVRSSGKAWISTTRLKGTIPVLRACVTSYRTRPADIEILVEALADARKKSHS